jgi:AraC-like DNA-binding protein
MLAVPRINNVWFFKAPFGESPSPRIIAEGNQEVEIITAGRGFYNYNGRTVEAFPGTLIFHNPGEETIYLNDTENPYECIVIVFEYLREYDFSGISQWPDRISFQSFIDNLLTEYHSEIRDIDKLSLYVFGQLYWFCKSASKDQPALNKRQEEIQRIIKWIDNNFHKDINIGYLADMAGLSIPHLHTVFRELVQQTPYQYIQSRRILEARKLLATTRLSIKEICLKTGFYDMGNFCRMFKKVHSVTAQEYRQLYADKR